MTAKERIRAILNQRPHDRLGWNFNDPNYKDITYVPGPRFLRPEAEGLEDWSHDAGLLARVPGFHGEVHMDSFGNIIGRLEGKTKGECVRGALQDGWEGLDSYRFPDFDAGEYTAYLTDRRLREDARYAMGAAVSVFSVLRDVRLMSNALMDTLEEPECVEEFLRRLHDFNLPILDAMAEHGVDGYIIYDDWGTQISPFISPRSFGELFQPAYARLADACHERGMDLIVHSCGCVYPLVEMMVDAGVNGFQFDQPELTGSRVWAEEFGSRAAFYCPVDIQKVLSTGDRAFIEKTALNMCDVFRANGGHLICKDYPSYGDIGVEDEWAKWAMDVILTHSDM